MNPIIQLAASALPGEKKYILLAGAGVSKDAGVPTAWDLMLETAKLLYCADGCVGDPSASELSEWFLSSQYAAMSYADLIGTVYLSHPEQQAFLAKFLSGYKPGESHKLIAELVRRDIIRAIVTTNFDSFIEQALEVLQIPVQVIANDDDLEHSEPLIHCKSVRIYKPHGTLGRGPTLYDLENSLKNGGPQVGAVWKDYVSALNEELGATRPDFSEFTDYDAAIVAQIERATATSIRLAEATIVAARYSSEGAARTMYMNFGKLASYAELPEGFSGHSRVTDFDGFKFVIYEMLVTLTAALMRYERWEILARILNERIFISRRHKSEYVSFAHFRAFLPSLDDLRNRRLKLNRASVTSDMLDARFTTGRLAKVMGFGEFYEADYLLYLHSAIHATGGDFWDTWLPLRGAG